MKPTSSKFKLSSCVKYCEEKELSEPRIVWLSMVKALLFCFYWTILQRRWTSLIFPNNRYLLHINLDNGVTLRKKYPKSSRKLSTLSNVTTPCPEKLTKSCLNLSQLWPKYCRSLFSGHGVLLKRRRSSDPVGPTFCRRVFLYFAAATVGAVLSSAACVAIRCL